MKFRVPGAVVPTTDDVKDIIVIAIVLGFFAVCAAYVVWCDRILASDAPDHATPHVRDAGRAASTTGATDVVSERTADSTESEADHARVI